MDKDNVKNDQSITSDLSEGVVQNTETKLSNFDKTLASFEAYIGENNYLILNKTEVFHFIKLINYHSRIGFDQYHTSFKIDTSTIEEGFVWLTYNSGLILARSKVKVEAYRGGLKSILVKVSQFIRAFNSSVECVFLYEEKDDLYAYLFGGRFYIETITVSTDICSSEYLMSYLDNSPEEKWEMGSDFIDIITMLSGMIKSGSRVDERSVYFRDGKSYIFCGNVLGEFAGISVDLTLQLSDIASLVSFFSDIPQDAMIEVESYAKYNTYRYKDRFVNMGKRKLTLSDEMKYTNIAIEDSIDLNSDKIKNIIHFLNASVGDSTVVITQENDSMIISCAQGDSHESRFPIISEVYGKGLNHVNIKLAITDIKNFMSPFGGKIKVKAHGNKIYVMNDIGGILMFGEV